MYIRTCFCPAAVPQEYISAMSDMTDTVQKLLVSECVCSDEGVCR